MADEHLTDAFAEPRHVHVVQMAEAASCWRSKRGVFFEGPVCFWLSQNGQHATGGNVAAASHTCSPEPAIRQRYNSRSSTPLRKSYGDHRMRPTMRTSQPSSFSSGKGA